MGDRLRKLGTVDIATPVDGGHCLLRTETKVLLLMALVEWLVLTSRKLHNLHRTAGENEVTIAYCTDYLFC